MCCLRTSEAQVPQKEAIELSCSTCVPCHAVAELPVIRIIPCPIFSPPRHPRRLAPSRRCAQVCGCAPARPMTAAVPCPHPVILPSCPSAAALPSVLPAAGSRAPSVPRPELRPAPSRVGWARWLLRRSLSTALPPELPLAPWRLAGFGISPLLSPASDERRALSFVFISFAF
jgi:hypothetical protein